ncbi:hypothetical protein CPB86DRAFT_704949 [Serendipita vermifera]|nr:hypothetical protein CPB86DRAFT_704949 [Serendipita vermifera]
MPRSRPFPPSQQKERETRAETTDLLQNNRFTSANAIISALQATDVKHLAKNLTSLRNQWTIRHDEEGKVASDDERLLLAKQYLQQSPTAAEIFNAWEYLSKHSIVHQHLAIGVFSSLLTLLSSQYIYHSIGLTVLRALLQSQSGRKLNAHLNSSQTDLVLVALKLWNAMANFGGGTERKQVFEEFSWGNKSLFRLFHMRRKGQVDLSADPFIKPDIRTLYISFILQFVQPSTLFIVKTAFLESHREVFLGLFKRLPEDPYLLVRKVLEICWDGIWSDNRLKRTIKIGLFGDQTLNQIIKLYSRSTAEGTDPESVPADLVHHFLLALCTRPGTGLCFKDNGWYPREEEEDEKAEELDETDGRTREDASRNKSKIYNHVLNHLLKNLKPTEDARQQELTLRILQACPELVSGYWTSSNLSMEPRLSSRWLINVAWMGSIISLPVPTESFFLPSGPSNNEYKPIAPPLSTILDNIIPSQWPKTFISKGLQNNSSLVQRNTALCLAQVLEKYAIALEHLKLAEKTLEEEADSGNWASRRRELEREMRKRVPNFEVIVAFLQQKISSAEWGTDPHSEPADRALRNAMVTESALRVMWLYHRSLPDIPTEARYDVGKLLDSAVLKRFLFSLTKINEKLDEEAEQSIPGFDAVSVLHILRLLEHNDQLTWHTNLGEGGQTHLHRLFQLYVLPLPSILSERCGKLVKLALGQGILFDHDNDEISIWIRALPRGTRAPDARGPDGEELVDEKDAVLSILDKCIKNCSSSPWKYVEAALAIYSDRITEMNADVEAWEEYSPSTAASPLLMNLIEVFKALLSGNIPSPSSTLLALSTYIRQLVFGISLKQPNIQYALRLTSELEQIISRTDQTEHPQTILDAITREVGLLRGSLYRMKEPVAVLDREDRQEILEFIVAVEHMHVEPHKRITTAYELIDWVRMNGQTLSQDSILQTIELIEEWFPPALRELAFHLDAFDKDAILLLCDENLGDPDLFLWIFMHASPDALTDEAVQDALADVVTSCPLDSAHSICTALLRRIEAFNEATNIISSINATLALWTSILSKLGQINARKIYKEFTFKSSPMIKLFTSTNVPNSTNAGKCLVGL